MPLGSIISAAGNLIGGLFGKSSADAARSSAEAHAARQEALQREFAQSGIQWKVADAKKAGIHPLYALGAQTTSYAPTTIGHVADTSMPTAMAAMGQDIGRAVNATRTAPQRQAAFEKTVQDLSVQKMGLENQLLASQIAKLRASTNPPFPSEEDASAAKRPPLALGGRIATDPMVANTEEATKRWGESADWWFGPQVMWYDYLRTQGLPRSSNFIDVLANTLRRDTAKVRERR